MYLHALFWRRWVWWSTTKLKIVEHWYFLATSTSLDMNVEKSSPSRNTEDRSMRWLRLYGYPAKLSQSLVYLEHLDSINKNSSEQDRARTVKDFFSRDSLIYFFGYLYIYYFWFYYYLYYHHCNCIELFNTPIGPPSFCWTGYCGVFW